MPNGMDAFAVGKDWQVAGAAGMAGTDSTHIFSVTHRHYPSTYLWADVRWREVNHFIASLANGR